MQLVETLQKLAFSENEAKVYLASLALGPASVQEISTRAGLNRLTAHGVIRGLLEKGLLRFEYLKNKRKVAPSPPLKLYELIGRHYERVKQEEKLLSFLIPELKQVMSERQGPATNVIYYEGEEGVRNWSADVLEAKGEILEWTKIEVFASKFREFLDQYYFPRKFALQIPTRFIFLDTPEARAYVEKRYMLPEASPMKARFIPKEKFSSPGFMVIYNNRLSIALPKELRAVAVEDKLIADTQRQIFEFGWQYATGEVQNKPYPLDSRQTK